MKKNNSIFYSIDLFAGCGGLSEGFRQAGFEVISHIEMDRWACETLITRSIYYYLKKFQRGNIYNKFLRNEISHDDILNKYPEIKEIISYTIVQSELVTETFDQILKKVDAARKFHNAPGFHAVISGPPCQPYSIVGRARDPDRMQLDNRHFLYKHYLKIIENLQPDFFVFENVPGLISAKFNGNGMLAQILDDFRNLSPRYEIAPGFNEYSKKPREYIIDSSKYGIPQKRKRIILIGYRKTLISKNHYIKNIFRVILNSEKSRYGGSTVADAIGDLPPLKPGEGSDSWFGEYTSNPFTPFQEKMRKGSPGILNHRARTHMSSDLERYKFFIEYHPNGNRNATLLDLMKEKPELIPAHNHLDKFINRFKVQWWSQPSSTIVAHICRDGHYYIHPDIHQCRSFTVREAARCQSFPDNFKFEGPRTEQFKQVGNAVPPELAKIIASKILENLKKIYGT